MAALSRRLVIQTIRVPSVLCRYTGTSGSSESSSGSENKMPESSTSEGQGPEPLLPQTDNTKYQAQQLFHYNEMSYYDVEREMDPYRLPQPSSKPQPTS